MILAKAVPLAMLGAWFVFPFLCIPSGSIQADENPQKGTAVETKETSLPQPARDAYGDVLPPGAVARLGTVRMRHHTIILSLALSPDGKTVATAGGDWMDDDVQNAIRLWDLTTGKEIRQLLGHSACPGQVVFSPDGKLLASGALHGARGTENSVRLWDVATGKQLHVFEGEKKRFGARQGERKLVAFSPDSKTLASNDQGEVLRFWDVSTGKELRRWPIPTGSSFIFSPDGQFIVLGSARTIALVDPNTGAQIRTFDCGRQANFVPLVFAHGGKELVGITTGLKLAEREVLCFDWQKGTLVRAIPGALLGASRDGRFLAFRRLGSDAVDIHVWDLMEAKETRRFPSRGCFVTHWGGMPSFTGALTEDGSTLIAADFNAIRVLDAKTGKARTPSGPSEEIVFVGFIADGSRLVSVGAGIRIWDVDGGKEVRSLTGHSGYMGSAALTKDARTLATASWDGTVRLWDLLNAKVTAGFDVGPGRPVVAFSPDQKTLAVAANATGKDDIHLWECDSGKVLRRFGAGGGSEALAFMPDGKLILFTGRVEIFDPKTGKPLRTLENMPNCLPTSLAISRDGRIVATGCHDKTIRDLLGREVALWHLPSATLIAGFKGHDAAIMSFAYSPDGTLLATGSWDGTVRVWEWLSGRELACFTGHRGCVRSLAFSRTGHLLASGGTDTSVLVWDLAAAYRRAVAPAVPLTNDTVRKLWRQLRSRDRAVGWQAMVRLAAGRDLTVSFFSDTLPRRILSEDQLGKLLAQLDNPVFALREEAVAELEEMMPDIRPILQKSLKDALSLEVRRRLDLILAKPPAAEPEGELSNLQLRELRTIHILESFNSEKSLRLLETLAKGTSAEFLTLEAKSALGRLSLRGKKIP